MLGGISMWQLAILAIIIILIFGTKKLHNVGGDLGSMVKSFKKAVIIDDVDDAQLLRQQNDSTDTGQDQNPEQAK